MRISASKNELCLKVVYYGPGQGGKTTNLAHLHAAYPTAQRGGLIQLDTESERTLFFDYFPVQLGTISGLRIKVDFFTVPGQSFYQATRRSVLEGADGVVFVADSDPDREEANLVARQDLERNLQASRRTLEGLPHVYQWNKRDLPRVLPEPLLNRMLNPEGAPSVGAVAARGAGVMETQSLVLRLIMEELRSSLGRTRHSA